MTNSLVLIGAGGHARSIIDIVESTSDWSLIGLIGQADEVGNSVCGYQVLGTDSLLPELRESCGYAFIAIGHLGSFNPRPSLVSSISYLNFVYPTLIASSAYVSPHAVVSSGTSIGHGAVINSGVHIGSHTIVNSCSLIEHDSHIGNFCHISTSAVLNGGVRLGDYSFIGSSSMIREQIHLPPSTIISAGSRIMGWPFFLTNSMSTLIIAEIEQPQRSARFSAGAYSEGL